MKDLDGAQLERKIRLLSLTTLAFQNIGRDLPYSSIAEVLQVEPSQVERWVIDGKLHATIHTTIQTKFSPHSAPRWTRRWQALADLTDLPHRTRLSPCVRARAVAGPREAARGVEDWPRVRARGHRLGAKEER